MLNHCIVEYSGWYATTDPGLAIYSSSVSITNSTIRKNKYQGIAIHNASPTISGCTVADNGGDGIRIEDNWYNPPRPSSPTITNCTFTGNGGYGVNGASVDSQSMISSNAYTGNGFNYAYYLGATLSVDTTFKAVNQPIVVGGGINVPQGITLTIEPGVTIRFVNVSDILSVAGTLKANGTTDQPITFTTNNASPAPGSWRGIYFTETSANSVLNHCIVEYSGWYATTDPGLAIYSSSVSITNSTIRKNQYQGIAIHNASPTISGCTVADNGGDGIKIEDNWYNPPRPASSPIITNCTFTGNGGYGVNSYTYSILDARYNNWGSPTGPLDDSDDRAIGGWYNPTGTGDRVSDRVMYDPWLGKPLMVTLTVAGSGKGIVTSEPAGIAANVSTTSTAFGYGDKLLLTAKADEYHLFSGWSGGCTNKAGDCAMTLTGDFSVTATFDPDTIHSARLNRPTPVYYSTLQEAYANAASGDTIQSWATTYEETLTLDKNKSVTFSGGYDQGYTAVKGKTGVKGSLTLGNGVTVLENIEVR